MESKMYQEQVMKKTNNPTPRHRSPRDLAEARPQTQPFPTGALTPPAPGGKTMKAKAPTQPRGRVTT